MPTKNLNDKHGNVAVPLPSNLFWKNQNLGLAGYTLQLGLVAL